MRISDWSSDVCSSDLIGVAADQAVVLASRVWRDHLADAESASETTHVAGRNRGARARIGRTIERDTLRSEEILDRKSVVEGKRVSEGVHLGVRRIIKKKNIKNR